MSLALVPLAAGVIGHGIFNRCRAAVEESAELEKSPSLLSIARLLKSKPFKKCFIRTNALSSEEEFFSGCCRNIMASNPNDEAKISNLDEAFPSYLFPSARQSDRLYPRMNCSGKLATTKLFL